MSSSIDHPLEATWVERPLTLTVEGCLVTGIARTNWGSVHVAITSPITHVVRGFDHRGWAFGLGASRYPELRYAFRGQITATGLREAERLLTELFLDWRAVSQHEHEADAACRRTRQEMVDVRVDFDARKLPLHGKRAVLRKRFKAGDLCQCDYQRLMKELTRQLQQLEWDCQTAERAAGEQFACWMNAICGRKVSLGDVETLLTQAALVVASKPLAPVFGGEELG